MDELHCTLLELQELDQAIGQAEQRASAFEPQLASVGAPVLELEREAMALRKRISRAEHDIRQLERLTAEKRARLPHHLERAERVRNAREEAAVRAELDQVRDSIDADENATLEKMELLERLQPEMAELHAKLTTARAEEARIRQELTAAQTAAAEELSVARSKREHRAIRIPDNVRKLYERLRGGKRLGVVIAPLTESGACGHCFNTLPVQEQSEIRRGGKLHHCEACGIVLYAVDGSHSYS